MKAEDQKRYLEIKGRIKDMMHSLREEIEGNKFVRVVAEIITEMDWLAKKIDELDRQKAA